MCDSFALNTPMTTELCCFTPKNDSHESLQKRSVKEDSCLKDLGQGLGASEEKTIKIGFCMFFFGGF